MSNLHIISICFYLEVEKCEASHFFSFITFYTIFYNCYIKIHSFCTEKSTPPQYWTQNDLDNHLFYGTQTCTKYQKIFFCLISQCLFLKLNVKVRYLNLRLNLNHHFLFPLTLSLSYKMSPWLLFHSLCFQGLSGLMQHSIQINDNLFIIVIPFMNLFAYSRHSFSGAQAAPLFIYSSFADPSCALEALVHGGLPRGGRRRVPYHLADSGPPQKVRNCIDV